MRSNPYIHLLRTSWKFASGRRGRFVLAYTFFVLANGVILLEPAVIGKVFDEIQNGVPDMQRLIWWMVAFGIIPVFFWLFHGTARIWERETAFVIERNAREYYLKAITELPLRWHTDHHSGQTHDRVEKAAHSVERFASHGFRDIEMITRAVFSLGAIAFYLPLAGAIATITTVAVVWSILRFDRILGRLEKTINERRHGMAAIFYDYVSNIKTIITLRLQKLAQTQHSQAIGKIFPVLRKEIRLNEVKWFAFSMILTVMSVAILWIYIKNGLAAGTIMLGGLVALYGYVSRFNDTFFTFGWQAQELLYMAVRLKAVDPVLEAHQKLAPTNVKERKQQWQNIVLKDIWFTYEDKEHREHQLQGVSLNIKRGQKIALVGESGSGKSTLLYLLRGLDKPKSYELTIDGEKQSDFGVLAGSTTLIPQDPEIFENTIGFNVTAGADRTDSEVVDAISLARFDQVLNRLPNGLDTNIKERGVNLSGGEKQRLALARGLYAAHDSSLLLMDEPTSSVDPVNELAIYKNVFANFSDSTVISTIHRLHLLQYFDYIYVLANGRIVEEGSYKDLEKRTDGILAAMIKHYGSTSQIA